MIWLLSGTFTQQKSSWTLPRLSCQPDVYIRIAGCNFIRTFVLFHLQYVPSVWRPVVHPTTKKMTLMEAANKLRDHINGQLQQIQKRSTAGQDERRSQPVRYIGKRKVTTVLIGSFLNGYLCKARSNWCAANRKLFSSELWLLCPEF